MSLQRILTEALAALIALVACAGAASGTEAMERNELLVSPVMAAKAGTAPNPYSFADLFNLTVGAQYGLVTATSVTLAKPDAGQPLTPALFGGMQVPSLTLGPGPASTSMIGIPDAAPFAGAAATNVGFGEAPAFQFEKELFPLSRMPEPAGWLIAASALLVAGFIARRRSR
jgi:hypothetical protein